MNAIYVTRYSDPKQSGNTSTEVQTKTNVAYCNHNGWNILGFHNFKEESAKGGSDQDRLREYIDFAKKYKGKADVFVVFKVDRFARNMGEHVFLKRELLRLGMALKSATENIDETPSGRLMENMLASIAQFDNDVRTERSAGGMLHKIENGIWPWKVPVGYYNRLDENNRADVAAIDEPVAKMVKSIMFDYASGASNEYQLAKKWEKKLVYNHAGKRVTFNRSTIEHLLDNPFYCGILHPGKRTSTTGFFRNLSQKEWAGKHKPLITKELFDQIQLRRHPPKNPIKHKLVINPLFPLKDKLYCQYCGRKITAGKVKGRGGQYPLYFCLNTACPNQHKKSIDKNLFENEFLELLKTIKPSEEKMAKLRLNLTTLYETNKSLFVSQAKVLRSKVDELEKQIDNLVTALSKGGDGEVLNPKIARLKTEVLLAKGEMNSVHEQEFKLEDLMNYADSFFRTMHLFWFNADTATKIKLQRLVFPKGIVYSFPGFLNTEISTMFRQIDEVAAANFAFGDPVGI